LGVRVLDWVDFFRMVRLLLAMPMPWVGRTTPGLHVFKDTSTRACCPVDSFQPVILRFHQSSR
jgi:hypothetical protein